ncbi:hypothetical protein JQU52_13005 [Paralysiella testudinis]|uniref:Uncharacterized protein n=1 Tax=Paralysiella testudinis TaxID=2809020 RepID=A0A892ZP31_9NEIS|nr:hypothetical protein JQU52_13005 [Paralysiella testudinis]
MNFEQVIEELVGMRGTLACAIVDYESGMLLDGRSVGTIDLDILSIGNTEIMRAEIKSIALLHEKDGQDDEIEDMLITLGMYYYLLRPMKSYPGLFVFSVLDKSKANLALARRALRDADRHFKA